MSSRAAPPVSVRCSGGLRWQGVQALLTAWAAVAVAVWLLQRAHHSLAWAVVAGFAAAGFAAWLARPRLAWLSFNGDCWSLDGVCGSLEVMFDGFGLFLLRLQPEEPSGKALWLACSHEEAAAALHGLRIALYAARNRAVESVAARPQPVGN